MPKKAPKKSEPLSKEELLKKWDLKLPESIPYDPVKAAKRERAERKKLGIPKGKYMYDFDDSDISYEEMQEIIEKEKAREKKK